jgi:rhodanese-related sulfurtransferase
VGELPPGEPVTVFCRSGHRAAMAASILESAGREVRLVPKGGAGSWPEPLEPVGAASE